FTPELLRKIENADVTLLKVLLHIGLGTFRPVKVDDIEKHDMHTEYYCVTDATARAFNQAKRDGRRIIAVGTTSVRVLESVADERGLIRAASGETGIFIYPPYKFKTVDGMITNFHLPKSTLIMLVSAFIGTENTMRLYRTAVQDQYRFYSFGDATLLLP
ncbi:MAG: S-adenosylmethionine:tRNA ribosyltransferase-isomerase, partial [Firmicutes bacterium]|nr:S-adenosylmethionine:tRNA ribosyltransferase-isomerase [Bacillota bacterium]